MSGTLIVRNRQRVRAVNGPRLRSLTRALLDEHICPHSYELGIHLVGEEEMALVNETFLHHNGSTDVITFNHADSGDENQLHGEIFVCLNDAVRQAGEFRTTWQSELVRYVIHGLLHLRGHDDLAAADRRRIKREENRLLREINRRFDLRALARAAK